MSSQQRGARSRRLAVTTAAVAASVVASVVLASGTGFAAGTARVADPPAPTPTVAPPVPVPAVTPPMPPIPPVPQPPTPPALTGSAFGAYLDYGPRGVARIAELSHWLGGAELRVGHTYLPGDRWTNIEGRHGFLDVWADWRTRQADRMLVLNVPMMERNEENVSDAEVRQLLRRGVAGEFDRHFRALAERLVELKVPDTVVVLGWEMNGTTYTHRCGPDPEAWKTYWKRIVTTMRAVPGQKFRFDFAPSRGRDAVPWTQCYPGDDTVDIIGMDSYDQPSGLSFEQQVKEPYGLQAQVDFAKAHGKAISYPEWGLFRNGDNSAYMRGMLAWMDAHKPLYNTLTDYCPHGVWQCADNPMSSQVYRSVLFGRTEGPTPEPTKPGGTTPPTTPATPTPPVTPTVPATPTAPVTPVPPTNCSPLQLGDWVEYWLGGKLCLRFDWWSRSR
ncbi:glycosyl hydrolase [Streptomyces pseudovenezuelae]|uniref:glycoside hydrolase family 26 protein n=1 Tax=Streptomyces pseudovenezuelae TaxID=67350 RepID=UPI002E303F9E|nr:glycosyl hydrolase [Streptomyces pseudovenezuelae]